MKINPNIISLIALCVSVIAVPLSACLSYRYAKKSFKFECYEYKISNLLLAKDRFIEDLDLFGLTGKSIAEYEFGTDFSKKAYVNEYNKFYQKLFDLGLVEKLYKDIERLNSNNFDLFLKKYDIQTYDAYKSFELSKSNKEIENNKKAHLVYQIFYEKMFLERLRDIKENDIRNFVENVKIK